MVLPVIIRDWNVTSLLGLWDTGADYIYGTSSGTGHTQLANPHLRWEKQAMFNMGVDFRFMNRFYGSFEYFHKSSKDLLL